MINEEVLIVLKIIQDPELGVSIVDLGLIYSAEILEESIDITMTFTTPSCPFATSIIQQIEELVESTFNKEARITITFDPHWNLDRVSESVKLEIGLL
jgi:metal-sulfur cluster biosynthetic enzyme